MSYTLIESDVWPRLRSVIMQEREERMEALLRVSPDKLAAQQGFVEALDWVMEEAKPKPPPRREEEDE